MKRRRFLLYAGAAVFSIGAGGFIYPYFHFDAPNAMRKQYIPQPVEGLTSEEIAILYLASLAPSGHNAQPWAVEIHAPGCWRVTASPSRQLPAIDPDNREMFLSIGAFLETLSHAAESQGYEANIELLTGDPFQNGVALVNLKKSGLVKPYENAITARRTIRKNLQNKPLAASDLTVLLGDCADSAVFYPKESAGGICLGEATFAANRAQMNRADAQQELAEWIRWTNREATAHGNGLTPESMEIEGFSRWYVKHFFQKDDVYSAKFKESGLQMVQEQTGSCAGWLILHSSGSSSKDALNTGRKLAAIWLNAQEKNIAIHPMMQALEEPPWNDTISTTLGLGGTIQCILRIGYVKEYPPPVSLRMPLHKIIQMP